MKRNTLYTLITSLILVSVSCTQNSETANNQPQIIIQKDTVYIYQEDSIAEDNFEGEVYASEDNQWVATNTPSYTPTLNTEQPSFWYEYPESSTNNTDYQIPYYVADNNYANQNYNDYNNGCK